VPRGNFGAMRHTTLGATMPETYTFGDFRLDAEAGTVFFHERPVKLTAKSIAVLRELARRAPQVVTREEFEAAVWPEGYIEASNLTQTIYMIRTTLARYAGQPVIETLNRRGYRLTMAAKR
jgi:DNA-binding winged helix-turn-helix (wHTH) protein